MGEFKEFGKILNIGKLYISITEKIHGSNAQVYIYPDKNNKLQVLAGSRSRWLTPDDDNYGFAKFVDANKEELIEKIGAGRHYGEWAGPGINNGAGLNEKTLLLFNWRRWKDKPDLPTNVGIVPILHTGKFEMDSIDKVMQDLKENGSRLSPGYMKPEGVVIEVGDNFYKKTFEIEEVAWTGKDKKDRVQIQYTDISHLLQPNRLQKLLSRDENYIRNYPESLPSICSDYVKDLESEQQITGTEDEVIAIKKSLGKKIFLFVKSIISELK